MSEEMLQLLLDRESISDTVRGYATGIDMRDWESFGSRFTDPVEVDLSSWSGAPVQTISLENWVRGVRHGLSGFQSTQHMITNHRIEVEGDEAVCRSNVQAAHFLPNERCNELFVLGGHYRHRLTRTEEGWKICSNRLSVTWTRGDHALFELAAIRVANGETVH